MGDCSPRRSQLKGRTTCSDPRSELNACSVLCRAGLSKADLTAFTDAITLRARLQATEFRTVHAAMFLQQPGGGALDGQASDGAALSAGFTPTTTTAAAVRLFMPQYCDEGSLRMYGHSLSAQLAATIAVTMAPSNMSVVRNTEAATLAATSGFAKHVSWETLNTELIEDALTACGPAGGAHLDPVVVALVPTSILFAEFFVALSASGLRKATYRICFHGRVRVGSRRSGPPRILRWSTGRVAVSPARSYSAGVCGPRHTFIYGPRGPVGRALPCRERVGPVLS